MQSTADLILTFIFSLLALLFWFRFLLQASKADRFNPISQAVIQASDKVCGPLRKVLPHISRIDLASLVFALLTGMLFVVLRFVIGNPDGFAGVTLFPVLISGTVWSLYQLTQFFFFAIIIMIVASFIAPGNYNPALGLLQSMLDPVMGPIRRLIPPFGPFDLTPMLVLLAIYVVQNLLRSI
ncbi:MAG: YggT family protein [Limisphaerales bacterium]|jgi:YggT family protein